MDRLAPGTLVYQSRDKFGEIQVREHGNERCLYLGSLTVQSAMYLHAPLALALAYTQAMMSFVLLQPSPSRVLLLGLGGGSLARFLHHQLPAASIDAVELRPAVVEAAKKCFGLIEDARLRIHVGDAGDFVANRAGAPAYDAILVDAYDGKGPASVTCSEDFPALCAQRLTAQGVAAWNLWSSDPSALATQLSRVAGAFAGEIVRLNVPNRGNVIALAGPAVANLANRRPLIPLARRLKREWNMDMPDYLRRMSPLRESSWRSWLRQTGLGSLTG